MESRRRSKASESNNEKRATSTVTKPKPIVAPHSLAKGETLSRAPKLPAIPTLKSRQSISKEPSTDKPKLQPIKKNEPEPRATTTFPVIDVSERKLMEIPITQLQTVIDAVHEKGQYTPLIIDPTGRADVYFQYATNCKIVDFKKFLVQCEIQKITTPQAVLEEIRTSLVSGLKHGKCMVMVMMDSAFDFPKWFDSAWFPKEVLEKGGIPFREKHVYEKCLRNEDFDDLGMFWANEDFPFRVVLTTNFDVDEYEEFLEDAIQLEKYMPIAIKKELI